MSSASGSVMTGRSIQRSIGRSATAAMITAERARGAAPETIPAADLATSLNQMNEHTMMATLSAEQPAVTEDRVVDTLTHIWVSSIYGEQA